MYLSFIADALHRLCPNTINMRVEGATFNFTPVTPAHIQKNEDMHKNSQRGEESHTVLLDFHSACKVHV